MNEEKLFVNGIEITPYKRWAYNLMMREASGETLRIVSADAWREVLGFAKDCSAKQAVEKLRQAA